MGIATCSASRQQPVQKVMTTKTPTPKGKHRLECQLSRSPRSVDVNTILADINLPQTGFETILTVLGLEAERNDEKEDNPAPPADTTQQMRRWTKPIFHPIRSPPQHPQTQTPQTTLL